MKERRHTYIIAILFVIGILLLLYPTVSNYVYSRNSARVISSYTKDVSEMKNETYNQKWNAALEYNRTVAYGKNYYLTDEQLSQYKNTLNFCDTGIIGSIEILKIKCSLPIYHGTGESALQMGVGHVEWTSLPTGEDNTHCVLSGHRGLPRAKLFTDLDKLEIGDTFVLHVLNKKMTYEIEQIQVVKPTDISALKIENGRDLCTLVTCTPYGVNSHRLLLKGHRIENAADISETSKEVKISPIFTVVLIILLIVSVVRFWRKFRKKSTGGGVCENNL